MWVYDRLALYRLWSDGYWELDMCIINLKQSGEVGEAVDC